MIPKSEGRHYLAVNKLSALLRGIILKRDSDFYCLSYRYLFKTKKLESHGQKCKNKDFCGVLMSSEGTKILDFNTGNLRRCCRLFFVDLESFNRKVYGCKNNPENLFTIKVGEHILRGFAMSTIWTFEGIESKDNINGGEDCMKKFCGSLREHSVKKINFEKNRIICQQTKRMKHIFIK